MVNVDGGYLLKAYETAPHVLLSNDLRLGHVYIVAMHRATWCGLAREDKEASRRAAKSAHKALSRVMDSSFDSMVADLNKAGARIRVLDRSKLDTWLKTTHYQQLQAKRAAEQVAKDVRAAGVAMEKIRKLLNDAMHKATCRTHGPLGQPTPCELVKGQSAPQITLRPHEVSNCSKRTRRRLAST